MLIIHTKCWGHVAHWFHHVPPWPTKCTPWVSVELEMSKHFSFKSTDLKTMPTFQRSIPRDTLTDPSTWMIAQLINNKTIRSTQMSGGISPWFWSCGDLFTWTGQKWNVHDLDFQASHVRTIKELSFLFEMQARQPNVPVFSLATGSGSCGASGWKKTEPFNPPANNWYNLLCEIKLSHSLSRTSMAEYSWTTW